MVPAVIQSSFCGKGFLFDAIMVGKKRVCRDFGLG